MFAKPHFHNLVSQAKIFSDAFFQIMRLFWSQANSETLDPPFQYSDETAHTLAEELLYNSDSSTCIGVVSAPSVFVAIRNILVRLCQIIFIIQRTS